MAQMCHVEANSKGSRDCRSSNVLATWCMVLTSFTCKEKRLSMILGIGIVGRLLLLTAFLEARFFLKLLIEKAQSTVVFEVEVFHVE